MAHEHSVFISDGMEERGFIKGVNGFPDIRFSFRPVTPDERREWYREVTANPSEYIFLTAKFLVSHMINWSLKEPLKVDRFRKLQLPIFDKFSNIIFGDTPSDPDSQLSEEEAKEHSQILMEATANKQTFGEARTDKDQGNS